MTINFWLKLANFVLRAWKRRNDSLFNKHLFWIFQWYMFFSSDTHFVTDNEKLKMWLWKSVSFIFGLFVVWLIMYIAFCIWLCAVMHSYHCSTLPLNVNRPQWEYIKLYFSVFLCHVLYLFYMLFIVYIISFLYVSHILYLFVYIYTYAC